MFRKKLLIFLCIATACLQGLCQQPTRESYHNGYYIRQYTELSGLVSNKCKYVFEDSRGFLWISTFQGLSRFDGQQFTNYGLQNGLPSVNITQVCEDSSGFIYVATAKGIARFTGRQHAGTDTCFYLYKSTSSLPSAISGMQVIDSNHIVFQQIGSGLYLLNNNRVSVLWNGVIEYEMSLFKDNVHNIYVYARDSFRIYNKTLQYQKSLRFPASGHMTFYYDNHSDIFQAYSNGNTYHINTKDIRLTGNAPDSISWFWVAAGGKGIYYSGSRNNLYFFNGATSTSILDLAGLSLSSNDLRQTRDGSIWITTSSGGVFRILPLPYQEKFKDAFIRTRNINGCNLADLNDTVKDITANAAFTKIKSSFTAAAFTDQKGNNWFCSKNGIYLQEAGKIPVLYTFTGNEKLFSQRAREVKGVTEDNYGNVWFYGYCGIICYSNKNFRQLTNRNGLSDDMFVKQLIIEKQGTVLLTDWYNLFRVEGDSLLKITRNIGLQNYIPNKLARDHAGFAWIDYNRKLYKLTKSSANNFTVTDSLVPYSFASPAEINSFEFDTGNNCWISYNDGSIKIFFPEASGKYSAQNSITYSIDDGMIPVTGSELTFHPVTNGDMLLSNRQNGKEKTFLLTAASLQDMRNSFPAQVWITEILINQNTPDWGRMGYLTGPLGIPAHPELLYSSNDIAFTYKGTFTRNSRALAYQFKLKGYNDNWITTTQTTANYTNLPPGEYSFAVRVVTSNGNWSNPLLYDFTILPPWYKTWWGRSLLFLLAGSAMLLLFYQWQRTIRKKEALAHLKQSDKFKTILISLLGHDIIIPLQYIGKVAAQLRVYNEKISRQTQLETLGDIQLTASQLHLYGESIIHWIKIQNSEIRSSLNKKIWVDDLLEELVKFHGPLCNEKNNQLVKIPGAQVRCFQDPLMIKIILHNLLINANKFTSNGQISLSCEDLNSQLVLTVSDSGKGMSGESVRSLNNFIPLNSNPGTRQEAGWGLGYIIIMDLLKFTKGNLHVESSPGKGTKIMIMLPMHSGTG